MESNQIVQGDALEKLGDLSDESIPLTVTSPPYGIGHEYASYDDASPLKEWMGFMVEILQELWRVTVSGGRVAINIGFRPTSKNGGFRFIPLDALLKTEGMDMGFEIVGDYTWDKGNVSAKPMGSYPYPVDVYPAYNDESIILFRKPGRREVSQERKKASKYTTETWSRAANSIWRVSSESMAGHSVDHSAIFPEEIPKRLIELYSFVDDVVLDPFVGTGTTAVVANTLGRQYLGYDIDENYVEYARERINEKKSVRQENSAIEW